MRAQVARLQLPDCPAPAPAAEWPTDLTFELELRQHRRSGPLLSAATSVAARRRDLRRACTQRSGARGQHGGRGPRAPLASLGPQLQAGMKAALMHLPINVRRFLAGAFAGALSKTATAPIETVRMQMMTTGKGRVVDIVQQTWARGGVFAFFSGNEADILRTMPSKAIELSAFDLYKRLLGGRDAAGKPKGPGGAATALAGAMAGVTSTLAMFPLETVRTRLAVDHRRYMNVPNALRTIAAEEGVLALYRGLSASLLGVIPYSAVRLGMYDGLRWAYRRSSGSDDVPPGVTAVFGAMAAVASSSASFPLEVVRRRMMMGNGPPASTLGALAYIARHEGVGALYNGIWLTWIKQAPQYAVTFMVYDLTKKALAVDNGPGPPKARPGDSTQHAAAAHRPGGSSQSPEQPARPPKAPSRSPGAAAAEQRLERRLEYWQRLIAA